MTKSYSDRRVFIDAVGKRYKLFTLSQTIRDGSIYISGFKNFPTIKWHGVDVANQQIIIKNVDSAPTEGKLSIHGSGMSTFRAHDEPPNHKLIIHGNYLYDTKKQALGLRHLATIYMEEPVEIPASEYITRNSDHFLSNSKDLMPFNMALFAIPRVNNINKVEVRDSFNIDDLEQFPPDSGFGLIELKYHQIAWYVYRTKYMDKWPASSHVSYSDGFWVPMFLRGFENDYMIINPSYSIKDDKLIITLAGKPEDYNENSYH